MSFSVLWNKARSSKIFFFLFFIGSFLAYEEIIRTITGITKGGSIGENILILFLFSLLLLFSTRLFKIFLSVFLLSALMFQGTHAVFYGGWINPTNLYLFFENASEVMSMVSSLNSLILIKSILFVAISLSMVIYLYVLARKTNGKIWVNLIIILLFILQPLRDGVFKPEKIEKRFTKDTHGIIRSFHNSYGVFSSLLLADIIGNKLYSDYRAPTYNKLLNSKPVFPNIFIYFGESLSSKYMGAYGYNKNTTPFINSLLNKKKLGDKDLFILSKETISGAVGTMPSSARFFHMLKKPDARKQAASFDTSIFKYAHEAGFVNYYISTQPENFINHIYKIVVGIYGNHYLTPPLIDSTYESRSFVNDDLVFKALEMLKIDDPFFMVFQPNGSHVPFTRNTRIDFKKFGTDSELSEYENSVYYTDHIIDLLIKRISDKSKERPWVFIVTSDHGTYVDQTLITRSRDYPASFMVPGIIFTNNKNIYQSYIEQFQSCKYLFHQNISEIIARIIGFNIPASNCDSGLLFDSLLNGFGAKTVNISSQGKVHIGLYAE